MDKDEARRYRRQGMKWFDAVRQWNMYAST